MSISKSTDDLNIIAKLDDEPNDIGGLTADQFKAKFDEGPIILQEFINDLVDILTNTATGTSGSENIGSAPISGLVGNTVYEQLAQLVAMTQQAQVGSLVNGSITDIKLSDDADQIKGRLSSFITTVNSALDGYDATTNIYAYKNIGGSL